MDFKTNWKRKQILSSIIKVIEDGEMSIADIQRKINMKRSTLIYYLSLLESQGLIEKNRIEEKKIGRPTMIKIPKKRISEINKKSKIRKKYTLEILKKLKQKGEMSLDKFHTLIPFNPKKPDFQDKFNSTLNVELSNLAEKFIRISQEGKKFLRENSKEK